MIANGEYQYNYEDEINEDYVPSKQEIDYLKEKMNLAAEAMKSERIMNSELLPVDDQGESIEVIKEQMLDINDKFDFLVKLMLEGKAIQAKRTLTEQVIHETQIDDFGNEVQAIKDIVKEEKTEFNLNNGSSEDSLEGISEEELLRFVTEFEREAKK